MWTYILSSVQIFGLDLRAYCGGNWICLFDGINWTSLNTTQANVYHRLTISDIKITATFTIDLNIGNISAKLAVEKQK